MTFGDHLEELRSCLIKSLLGLVVGIAVGCFLATPMVHVVKGPLESSLGVYYETAAVKQYKEFAAERQAEGKEIPYTIAQVENLVNEQGYIYTNFLVHPQAVVSELGLKSEASDAKPSARSIDELVPLFVWRKIENDDRVSVTALAAPEAFTIWLKAVLVSGFVVASPWIFLQAWSFVAAGLYPNERAYVHIFLPFSIALFLTGALFCFFFIFPFILEFLFEFNETLGIDPDPRISEWISFALMLPLGFGVSFQLPLVMLFLERIGVFSVAVYLTKWRMAILVIFVLSMFLTPADPISMLAMALPLTALYFGGIALCRYMPRRKGMLDD